MPSSYCGPVTGLGRAVERARVRTRVLAAVELRFEYAAGLRDEINDLRREIRDAG